MTGKRVNLSAKLIITHEARISENAYICDKLVENSSFGVNIEFGEGGVDYNVHDWNFAAKSIPTPEL